MKKTWTYLWKSPIRGITFFFQVIAAVLYPGTVKLGGPVGFHMAIAVVIYGGIGAMLLYVEVLRVRKVARLHSQMARQLLHNVKDFGVPGDTAIDAARVQIERDTWAVDGDVNFQTTMAGRTISIRAKGYHKVVPDEKGR